LAFRTVNTAAWVGYTGTVDTGFVQRAAHLGAAGYALTVATEMARLTIGGSTWVRQTLDAIAHRTLGTTRRHTIVRLALAFPAPLALGTFEAVGAGVYALSRGLVTSMSQGTLNTVTGLETEVLCPIAD